MTRAGILAAVLVTLSACGAATGLEAQQGGCPAGITPGRHTVSAVVIASDCAGNQPPGWSWSGPMDFTSCQQSACSVRCIAGDQSTELTWNGATWNYQYTGPGCSVLYDATIAVGAP